MSNNFCPKCGKPGAWVGDWFGGPDDEKPWCTCIEETQDMLAKEQLKKGIDNAYVEFTQVSKISEDLKNKIYRLAYLVPHTHPDPKVEEAYKEIIDELEKEI